MRVLIGVALSLLICASTGSVAIAATATPVPEMKADWSPWAFEIGTWACHGHVTGRPGDRLETDVNAMAFDNHWMTTRSDSPPFDPKRTKHSIGIGYLSYDTTNHMWYSWGADNFGAALGYATSPGWTGNTITFTAYQMKNGKWTGAGRTTTTKVNAAEIRDVSWDENGKISFRDDCKKQ